MCYTPMIFIIIFCNAHVMIRSSIICLKKLYSVLYYLIILITLFQQFCTIAQLFSIARASSLPGNY